VVLVEGEPNRDALLRRALDRSRDEALGLVCEPEVVDRDLERPLRGGDEVGQRVRDLDRRLAAVGERPELGQRACCARMRALYSRLAA
jgi:hypothetical protein